MRCDAMRFECSRSSLFNVGFLELSKQLLGGGSSNTDRCRCRCTKSVYLLRTFPNCTTKNSTKKQEFGLFCFVIVVGALADLSANSVHHKTLRHHKRIDNLDWLVRYNMLVGHVIKQPIFFSNGCGMFWMWMMLHDCLFVRVGVVAVCSVRFAGVGSSKNVECTSGIVETQPTASKERSGC